MPNSGQWGAGRLVWVVVSVSCWLVSAGQAQVAADDPGALFVAVRESARILRSEGRTAAAIERCESFLLRFPGTSGHNEALVGLLRDIYDQDVKDRNERQAWSERILSDFQECPQYYATGAANLVGLLATSDSTDDRRRGVTVATDALQRLGARLPLHHYSGLYLVARCVQATRAAGRAQDAVDLAQDWAEKAPLLLSHWLFIDEVYQSTAAIGDPHDCLAAAKLEFVLCDYAPSSLERAVKAVSTALHGSVGPGGFRAFEQAQGRPDAANPLRDVPLLDLGDPVAMQAAAADSLAAQINVALYANDLAAAVELAKRQLRAAPHDDAYRVNAALRDLARCFKARDLNLIRANQLLAYHRTGDGENPLPELERELEEAATKR